MKKTILIDIDGVLNEYKGNYDENFIPPARKDADDFLKELNTDFTVKIFTTRPQEKAYEWIISNNLKQYIDGITDKKEPAFLIIDDRCIKFEGDYKKALENIRNFKVWYK